MFKNRTTGGTQGLFEYLLGQGPPDWLAYGPIPIIISSALHYYTFFFLFTSAALMSIDSNLEEAGELMGANRWRILRKITFPLIIPALLSGFIMTFSKVMGTFGGPNVLGIPVRYYTISTMIRADMKLSNYADGFVLAISLILFAMTTVYINQRVVGTRKSYETIGGHGFVANRTKLRNWRFFLTAIVIIFQITVAFLPLALLTLSTFMLNDGDYSLSNFSLAHWIGESDPDINHGMPGVLRNPAIYQAAWNTIMLSLCTAFFVAVLGVILGYAIVKGRGTRLGKLVEQISFIPYVIPGIAFGAVYISMFAQPVGPIPALYGTFALLVIVSVAKHIPYSARSGVSAMLQVGRELEEAAAVTAPTPVRVSRRPLSLQMLANFRLFIHWLTSAKVVLALFMLVLMVYLILVPLYRMLEATVTFQDRDIHSVPDAVVGQLTTYHWVRMLTEPISEVLTYAPLQHSLTISIGATLLALFIGGAWPGWWSAPICRAETSSIPWRPSPTSCRPGPSPRPGWSCSRTGRPAERRGFSNTCWDRVHRTGCRMGRCQSSSAARCITTLSSSCL